jgi:hypothetical protein
VRILTLRRARVESCWCAVTRCGRVEPGEPLLTAAARRGRNQG